MRWIGPETLVDVVLEGHEVLALADSGSQVNTMMPEFMQEWGYPVLPLDKLVNYPLHLVGLGRQCTCPLGFVITRLQVREVAGYDEDIVFLVVPDESAFGRWVPLVIGTCTLAQVINVIKEGEMNWISTPWATIGLAQLLSWCVMTEETPNEGATGTDSLAEEEVDAVIEMKDSVHVGPFQAEILEGKISQAPVHDTHVMVAPIRHADVKSGRVHQLPRGL